MAEKNLVEEAILQMENLQEAITNNAKGILASTMKEEISQLVKESLSEEDEIEVTDTEISEQGEENLDLDMDVEGEDEGDDVSLELDVDSLSDNEDEVDVEDLEMGDEEGLLSDLPDGDFDDEESDVSDLEPLDDLDLRDASYDEIATVFKAMGPDDGIIVVNKDDGVHVKDEEENTEYIIKLDEEENKEGDYMEEEEEIEEGDDIVYEITLEEEEEEEDEDDEEEEEEEDETEEEMSEGEKSYEEALEGFAKRRKEEPKETTRTNAALRKSPNAKHVSEPTKKYAKDRFRPAVKESKLEKEVSQLREKNEEYRKALNIFREKLNEVAVFNSNLAYATRLFTEHSTTKQEKINILRRFDSVETLKESKSLYKLIKEDLTGKEQPIVTESVQSKVQKSPTKGSASNLIESKTYENPQFQRMKDLMNKIK